MSKRGQKLRFVSTRHAHPWRVKARGRSRPFPDTTTAPDDPPLDEIERAVVKALVSILIREIGEEMAAESRPRRAVKGENADRPG